MALHVCHDLSCWLRAGEARHRRAARALRRGRRRRAGRGVLPGPLRRRAGRRGQRAARRRCPTSTRWSPAPGRRRGRRAGDEPRPSRGPTTRTRPARGSPSGTRRCARCWPASSTPTTIVATLKDSGLRGMGGAGLPDRARSGSWSRGTEPGTVKYAICNADESEPGTFKDRQILADQPHLVLEGLLLRHGRGRRRAGLGVHPARVRPRGTRAARGDGRAARGRRDRAGRLRQRAAAGRSRSSSRPAATSSARRPRCWSAWRATAASRATSRRSPATTACTAGRR